VSVAETFEKAISRLKKEFGSIYDEALWTERDFEYRLGNLWEDELRNAGIRLRVHYGAPLSTADYAWWSRKRYESVAEQIEKVRSKLGKGKRIDLVLYDDEDRSDRLPIFPLAAEVKYAYLYDGSLRDKSYVAWYRRDRDKLKLLKRHNLAGDIRFVCIDSRPKPFHAIFEDWDPVKVHLVLMEQAKV
jgi:hypothetical protein